MLKIYYYLLVSTTYIYGALYKYSLCYLRTVCNQSIILVRAFYFRVLISLAVLSIMLQHLVNLMKLLSLLKNMVLTQDAKQGKHL